MMNKKYVKTVCIVVAAILVVLVAVWLLTKSERDFKATAAKREMVYVEAGTFSMGSTTGYDREKPVHSVTLSDFYIGKYEVTQRLYEEVMGINPSDENRGIGDNYPVNNIDWYDAVKFCNELSKLDGFDPVYTIGSGDSPDVRADWTATGYRLPTEAEWEYASRGGSKSEGYEYSGSDNTEDVAWYSVNSGGKTHPAGEKTSNELGIYDMSGNVWEWGWNWYEAYSSESETDPRGPDSGSGRVLRGGSWGNGIADTRSAFRNYAGPDYKDIYLGFRILLPVVK